LSRYDARRGPSLRRFIPLSWSRLIMLKKILMAAAMLYAAATFAAVEVNKASAADLDGIKGIGPGTSERILQERKKGKFKDWEDFIQRVKGVGETTAAKFSADGLTVNGSAYAPATAKPETRQKPPADTKAATDDKPGSPQK